MQPFFNMPLSNTTRSWWTDSLLLTLLTFFFFFLFLGDRPLFTPDEGRYAEIAREMVARGDYVTPYLNDIKYFEKPALFYWLGAIAIKMGGATITAVRSINAFLAMLGALLTYLVARKSHDRETGLLAAAILSTSLLYFVMARMVSLDLPVTVFLSACLYAFILGANAENHQKQWLYFLGAIALSGLAVLTKGLIGIVLPAMIIGTWIGCTRNWRLLKSFPYFSGLLLFLAITFPWHWLVATRNPEFFYFYFIEQHFLRYTSMTIGHYQPVWYFIPVLFIAFFPWIVFLPETLTRSVQGILKRSPTSNTTLYFLLWATLIFIFFSFSKSKLIPYILPVIPPLSILCAHTLRHSKSKMGFALLLLLSIAISYTLIHFTHTDTLPDPLTAKRDSLIASALLITGSLTACVLAFRCRVMALLVTIATAVCFELVLIKAIPAIETRTVLPFATKILMLGKPDDEVITYNQYYQDLPFYLQKRVTILNWRNEMSFGMNYQDTHEWMINNQTFWERWEGAKRVFVIMGRDEFLQFQKNHPGAKGVIIDQSVNNVLISNQP